MILHKKIITCTSCEDTILKIKQIRNASEIISADLSREKLVSRPITEFKHGDPVQYLYV